MRRPLRQGLKVIVALVVFLVLVGATYQGVTTAVERRRFPFPGRLVDIGSHQLHLYCTGSGTPTVILEAPAAGMSAAWGWVQSSLEGRTRVCSYDRTGLGWSDGTTGPFDPDTAIAELHALLMRSNEPGPFILVGEGFGALIVEGYAARHPGDVQAIVLVDASTSLPARRDQVVGRLRGAPWLARIGVLRATNAMASAAVGLPEPAGGALRAFLNRPDHLARASREVARWDDLAADASTSLPQELAVERVDTEPGEGALFLTDPRDADLVVAALQGLVRAASEARASAP